MEGKTLAAAYKDCSAHIASMLALPHKQFSSQSLPRACTCRRLPHQTYKICGNLCPRLSGTHRCRLGLFLRPYPLHSGRQFLKRNTCTRIPSQLRFTNTLLLQSDIKHKTPQLLHPQSISGYHPGSFRFPLLLPVCAPFFGQQGPLHQSPPSILLHPTYPRHAICPNCTLVRH